MLPHKDAVNTYVVFELGLTVKDFDVAPVCHEYVAVHVFSNVIASILNGEHPLSIIFKILYSPFVVTQISW